MNDSSSHPLHRTRLIEGFSELAVWVIRSGPENGRRWLIEASLVGVKGLNPEIKTHLAETHFVPMWSAVLQEKFRAEEHGARRVDLLKRVAGTEQRVTLDGDAFLPSGP